MSPSAGSDSAQPDPYSYGHGNPRISVEHYDLDLDYRVRSNRLSGTASLRVRTLEAVDEVALDLGGMSVQGVTVAGASLVRHRHRAGRLTLRLDGVLPRGSLLQVQVRYAGTPRPVSSSWGPVGWEELEDGVIVASQPTGAPSWFPCNDRPDDKATYRTSLTVENPYVVVAHGTPAGTRTRAGTTTWTFDQRHPTPAYLATVQVGRYTEVALAEAPVPQRALVPPALTASARHRLARHAEMLATFSELFGPYPFDEYTLVVTADPLEIPLEAQGMAIFGSNHLRPDGDGDRLVPHELAHQWFGNSVSVASWRDIWLNEGFACYAEWEWAEASGQGSVDALAAEHWRRLTQLPQDLVLSDPGPANIFDDRVYKRGALTLHAVRRTLGDALYRDLVREWTSRHRGRAVTTADFRRLAVEHAAIAGDDALVERVVALLADWLDRPEVPALPPTTASRPRSLSTHLRRPARSSGSPS